MSVQVLTNCKLWCDQFDLSGHTNKLGLSYGAKAQEATAFSNDTENYLPGVKTFKAAHEVLFESGTALDDILFPRATAGGVIMSIGPTTGAESEPGYTGKVQGARYTPSFTPGGVPRASFDAESQDRLVKGLIAANRTATTNSTGPILTTPGPAVGQSVYAALHILALSGSAGPTLAVVVQSAAAVGFGSPTTRITLATQNALGAVWGTLAVPLAGPAITDGYWRVSYTITRTNPSFTFVVVLGIQ